LSWCPAKASRAITSPSCQRIKRCWEPNVATVTLSAPESYGIDGGQPLVLHGVKVGQVLERKLTAKGVTFQVAIARIPRSDSRRQQICG
jgi:paraquat-inducible protein B